MKDNEHLNEFFINDFDEKYYEIFSEKYANKNTSPRLVKSDRMIDRKSNRFLVLNRHEIKTYGSISRETYFGGFFDDEINIVYLKFEDGKKMLPYDLRKIVEEYDLFSVAIVAEQNNTVNIALNIYFNDEAVIDVIKFEQASLGCTILANIDKYTNESSYTASFNFHKLISNASRSYFGCSCKEYDGKYLINWVDPTGINLVASLLEYRMQHVN